MSKKRNNKNTRLSSPSQRDILTPIASPQLLGRTIKLRSLQQIQLDNARLFQQDLRTYSPIAKRTRPLSPTVRGFVASTNIQKSRPLNLARTYFENPKKVTTCVRRGVRKEVLHALKKTGAGSRAKNRRFTSTSKIKC